MQQLRSTHSKLYSLALVLMMFVTLSSAALAQTYRGAIHGTVTDASGAAVPAASVIAVETSTNFTYKTVASSTGDFEFATLPLGTYTVTITAPSFSTSKYDKVTIEAGAVYTLPAKLSASNVSQTVEVTAAQLTLDTSTDTQSTVLPEVVVQNLPNSGRDFTQMLSQTPGFAGLSTGGGAGAASVNGTRSNSVNWQIDGTDNNDLWWNIPAVNQGGVSAIAGVVLPIDGIQNFAFATAGDITLGRNPGGTANVTLKSGGNHFHGTAYYYNHNEFFERQNPFESSKSASRNQHYGFSVGGPIFKDKFFFFLSGEHQNFLIGAENNPTEPSAAYQAAATDLLSSYGIPVNQVSLNLLNGNGTTPGLWPSSALTGPAAPNNYAANGNLTGHSFNGIAKLDANLSAKDHLSASWIVGQGTQTAPTSSDLAPYFENAPIHVQNYSIIYNRSVTPSIANQLSMGVSYFNQVFGDHDISFDPLALGLNTGVTTTDLAGSPHLIIGPSGASAGLTGGNDGFDPIGVTAPSGRNDITGHVDDDLSWTKGAHQMHFGGEFRQAQTDDFYQTGQRGTIYFDGTQGPWATNSSTSTPCDALAEGTGRGTPKPNTSGPASNVLELADFLAGCYDPSASSIVLGDPKRQVFVNTFAVYGADVYQVAKRFSLNFGLRYDYEGPIHSHYPNLSVFDPSLPGGLAVAGQDVPNIYNKFWGAVSPRIGFAYQLDNSGKTVLRGGYGFYYDTFFMKSVLQNNGTQNIPVFGAGQNPVGSNIVADAQGINAVIQSGVDIFPTFASATSGTPAAGSVSISTFDKNLKPSDTQTFDLNIQHSITPSVIMQIGYVGAKGTHLLGMFDINPAAVNSTGSPDTTTRPYYNQFPAFGVIDEARSNLGSIYHSLQTTLKVQGWHGINSQLAYTWSHALDYETGLLPYLPQDPHNEKAEYGNSDFDVRNTFTGYIDYAIPAFKGPSRLTHGWEVNSGFSIHGGTAYTVDASYNTSGEGDNADRAVQIANPKVGANHKIVNSTVQWFGPNDFVDPAAGTYSPTRRGQNYNPGYNAFDVAGIKNTAIAEGVSLQFRADIYNIFNHINLAPVGLPASGEGGTIGSTIGPYLGNPGIGPGEPLNVEFALKVIF
jgi:hypothetical protein